MLRWLQWENMFYKQSAHGVCLKSWYNLNELNVLKRKCSQCTRKYAFMITNSWIGLLEAIYSMVWCVENTPHKPLVHKRKERKNRRVFDIMLCWMINTTRLRHVAIGRKQNVADGCCGSMQRMFTKWMRQPNSFSPSLWHAWLLFSLISLWDKIYCRHTQFRLTIARCLRSQSMLLLFSYTNGLSQFCCIRIRTKLKTIW